MKGLIKFPKSFLKSFLFSIGFFFFMASVVQAEAPSHQFVGAKKCAICHKTEAQGAQYDIWMNSKHAKAFETLGTPEAKEVASKVGVTDPQSSGECLQCHSTAYGFSKEKVSEIIPVEEGISCESCHGAGKDYMKKSVMEDVAAAKEAGLLIPNEQTCAKCHNEKNPTFKPFDYKERFEKIKHPIPKNA
ncbi:MAG: cytochrome c3 family protein [Candidatus Omnitrophica bacterium]|nr:cytochrome c3 family protein [Candidatus Omnitrophota bacterium]